MSAHYKTKYVNRVVTPSPVPAPYKLAEFDSEALLSRKSDLQETLQQKINKIISALKLCDFYLGKDGLLINDPLNSTNDLQETIEQFGFLYKKVDANLRGVSYVINDKIVDLLHIIGGGVKIKNNRLKEANNEINKIITENSQKQTFDSNLLNAVNEVKEKGKIIMMSNDPKENYQKINALRDFSMKVNMAIEDANIDIRKGIVYVINTRAKKMGYSVTSQVSGGRVHMTLEKY